VDDNNNRPFLRFKNRMAEAARAWREARKPTGAPRWQSPNLDRMGEFHETNGPDYSAAEEEFFRASVAARETAGTPAMIKSPVGVTTILAQGAGGE
jgi:hypothetical protein